MPDPVKQPVRRDVDDDDLSILDAIKSLWKSRQNPKPQEGGAGGKVRERKIDQMVDDAVAGAPATDEY